MDRWQRRYLTPRVWHLLPAVDLKDNPYAEALCGAAPKWSSTWYGATSQNVGDTRSRLPICGHCERVRKIREGAI
jgi:hypothetical protein